MMKPRTRKTHGKEGAAMATVLMLVVAVSAFVAIIVSSKLQNIYLTTKLEDRVRAKAIAEGGVNHAYNVLAENWDARLAENNGEMYEANAGGMEEEELNGTYSNMFPNTSFAGGTYDCAIIAHSNDFAVVRSTGDYGEGSDTVILDIRRPSAGSSNGPSGPPPDSAWEKTIFANNELWLNGNGDVEGAMHANNDARVNGNLEIVPGPTYITSGTEVRVSGNVLTLGALTAPTVIITGNNDAPIDVNEIAVAPIPFPVVDLTELYNIALANGQVVQGNAAGRKIYNNDLTWTSIPGGVKWINAFNKVRFKGNITYDCIIVCTGAIQIDGNSNWDDPGNTGAMFSRDSWIKINGNCEVESLLHAPGNVTLGGNVRLEGQIISGNDVALNGNIEVLHYTYSGWSEEEEGEASLASSTYTVWQR
jgi:cytoskeletal protein CcmA (bactofilin family)